MLGKDIWVLAYCEPADWTVELTPPEDWDYPLGFGDIFNNVARDIQNLFAQFARNTGKTVRGISISQAIADEVKGRFSGVEEVAQLFGLNVYVRQKVKPPPTLEEIRALRNSGPKWNPHAKRGKGGRA